MFLDGEAALVVFIGPAAVADGADIDEADLGLVLRQRGQREAERQRRRGQNSGEGH